MAKYDKGGTASVRKLNITKDEIKEAKESPTQLREVQEAQPQSFTVFLINMSDLVIEFNCFNYTDTGPNQWYSLPPIGRNCSSDADTCAAQQQWAPVARTDCTYAPYQLTLATRQGQGATWSITPDCGSAGAWIELPAN